MAKWLWRSVIPSEPRGDEGSLAQPTTDVDTVE